MFCFLLLVSCEQNSNIFQNGALVDDQGSEVIAEVTENPTSVPTATDVPVSPTETPSQDVVEQNKEPQPADWVLSENAEEYLGQVITVRVQVSQCAYKPSINGSPTFCNDQPYPNHTFTYLMWGVDISQFDQLCVLVTGEIVEYDGKPQIVLESEEQIIPCDD
jgi:hypothetical protein